MSNETSKKVGILTFHRAINYGALMQTYGLQEALKSLGADAKVIDYRCPYVEDAYRLLWGLNKKSLRSWKNTLKGVPAVKEKRQMFRDFASKYLDLSDVYTKENAASMEGAFDEFVTGSDQVWNMSICGADTTYLLGNIKDNSKKNGYAVSLGAYKLNKAETELASQYKNISMREKGGYDYISGLLNREVHADVDPTMLLESEKWEALVNKERVEKEKYIFIYSVHPQHRMVAYANKLAKEKGLKVIHLHNRVKMNLKEPGVEVMTHCTPNEFLTLIHDAEYVVTNSFHGTVFSIIYHKKFFSELETKGGFNNRVWDLFKSLGLERRVLENVPTVNDGVTIDEEIDYNQVEEKLAALRAHSMDYLKTIVK